MKIKLTVVVVILSFLLVGCATGPISISPRYQPSLQPETPQGDPIRVDLQIRDERGDNVFYQDLLGNFPSLYALTLSPQQIIQEGFTEALKSYGYELSMDADIKYSVAIKRFLVLQRFDAKGVNAEIVLDVTVKRGIQILSKRTVIEKDTEKGTSYRPRQEVIEPVLSRSLSRAIERAVKDPNLNAAIQGSSLSAKHLAESNPAQSTLTATSVEKEIERLRAVSALGEKKKNIAGAGESIDATEQPDSYVAEKSKGKSDNYNFVERVQSQTAHQIPEDVSEGLWLATVPLNLDVFAFPSTVKDLQKLSLLRSWTKGKSLSPYHLGKTPLHVVLKPGSYTIVFVHPPLPDDVFQLRYYQASFRTYNRVIQVDLPVFPFIAPSGGGYVFTGDISDPLDGIAWPPGTGDHYYWIQKRDFTTKPELSTMLVLFQREDQSISSLLKDLPDRQNFLFTAGDQLRELSIKNYPQDLTEKEIAEAERALRRGGVWAKRFDDKLSLSLEVQENGGALARLHPQQNGAAIYDRGRFVGEVSDGKKVATKQLPPSQQPLTATSAVMSGTPQHESAQTDSQGVTLGRSEDFLVFRDLESTFAVEFPKTLEVKQKKQVIPLFGIRLHTQIYQAGSSNIFLAVMVINRRLQDLPDNRTADEVAEDVLNGAFSAGGVAIQKKETLPTRDGCKAVGAFGQKGEINVSYQVHACAHRVFQVQALSDRDIQNDRVAERFLKSFVVLPYSR